MNALLLTVLIIVIIGAAVFFVLAKGNTKAREFPYQFSKSFLSKAERSFYDVLIQATENTGVVFAKVRVADVLTPRKGLNRSDWQRAFNAVSAKRFDFLICDQQDNSVKLALELDDSSHESASDKKRDNLLNGACGSAGLPLLRIKAAKTYALADIKRQIEEAILRPKELPTTEAATHAPRIEAMERLRANAGSRVAPEAPKVQHRKTVTLASEVPKATSQNCPKCGAPMVLRKSKLGGNAGQEFWGCSAFPKCRGVAKVNA